MAKKQWQPLPAIPKESVPASGKQATPELPAPADQAQAEPVKAQAAPRQMRPTQRGPLGGLGSVMGNMGPLPLVVAVAAMNRGGGLSAMTTQGNSQMGAVDMKSLLGDIAGYLPGNSGLSATRASKMLGMMDELRSPVGPTTAAATVTTMNPMERNMGLIGALGRNLPIAGAGNLTMISQMMGMMNNFRGTMQTQGVQNGGGPLGALSALGNLGNMANMVNTMRTVGGAMNTMGNMGAAPSQQPQAQQAPPVLQGTVLPSQNDIKDTVNRLLNGMDDRQKSDLMEKARQFLGQR